jgi:hypothetical protein
VIAPSRDLLLKVNCEATSANITAGIGKDSHYIWPEAYVSKAGGAWEKITLSGTKADPASPWLKGAATTNIPGINSAQTNFLTAYVCTWNGTEWKCGCLDATCQGETGNKWMIQRFGR